MAVRSFRFEISDKTRRDLAGSSNTKQRSNTRLPFLSGGFRPFFLGGSIWAVCVALLWVMSLSGIITLQTRFDPLAWHRHEMLFGYLGAIIAGFLLTAIPNWTGRPPVSGARLAALALLWLAGRIAVFFSTHIGWTIAAFVDAGFLFAMASVAAHEIIKANNRNLAVVGALLLFATGSALDHLTIGDRQVSGDLGWQLGFAVVLFLIALIGGRIIPTFTRNWLSARGRADHLPPVFNGFDKVVMAATALGLVSWVVMRATLLSGAMLILAGVLQAARLSRWGGARTTAEPLVSMLHVAYGWLPLGLLLLGLSSFLPSLSGSTALHALSAGAMASMTLAVMARATLGHTGHALRSDRWTTCIFILVTVGALLRVGAMFLPFDYLRTISVAGTLWASAFALFVVTYGLKLLRPRADAASR